MDSHISALRDPERLAALLRTGLLDSDPEPVFDRIAELAAQLIGAPVALVSLVDGSRQFFKSCVGLPPIPGRETPLSHSFCQYTVSQRDPLVVRDAREHPLLKDNLAIRDLRVVAYAGIPLITREGHALGAFCAIDHEPRDWQEGELKLLGTLAEAVVAAIELRQEAERHRQTADRIGDQEKQLRLLLDQLPAIIWTTDTELRLISARGLGTLVDLDASERLRGQPLAVVFAESEEMRDVVLGAHRRSLRGESVRYTTSWGGREFDSYVEPLRTEEGRIRGVVGVAHDVSERRRAEREHAETQQQFAGLLEHVSDLVAVIAPEGTVQYQSPSVERALGYPQEVVQGRHFQEFIHPDDLPETEEVFNRLVRTPGGVESWQLRLKAADSTHRHVEAVAKSAVHVPELRGVVWVGRDITQRVRIQRELAERDQQLLQAQKLDAVGRLAGGVAHDFNNLLTVMAGHAEFLRMLVTGPDAQAEVEGVQEAVQRAAELTRQLLTFSGDRLTEPRTLELQEVVDRLAKMLRRLIGEDIRLELETDEKVVVEIDPAQLEQVVVNLVVNARDAMPRGGQLRVSVGQEQVTAARGLTSGRIEPGPYAVLGVEDTGTGMDAETVSHMFEPFFTTKGSEGTGLGLATVFGIVTQMGGAIAVDTELGQGTRFRIYLPVAERPDQRPAAAEQALAAGGSERILLVEDEPAVRALTARTLRDAGYDVVTAEDATSAREVLQDRGQPDLLVTDVIMPGESGPELFESLGPEGEDLPVLYLSGYADRKLAPHGVLDGRRRFLPKPYARDDLLREVRAAIEGPDSDA